MYSNCCNTAMLHDVPLHTCAHTDLEVSKNELRLINIYDAAHSCEDLALMLKQQKYISGFIPLSNLVHHEAKNMNRCVRDKELSMEPVRLHYLVKKYDLPNFLGARIQVNFGLNLDLLDLLLKDCWDWQMPLFLRYGFPMNFEGDHNALCST